MGQSVPAVLVEEPPEWEFSGGHFFPTWNGQRWAFPPNVFFKKFASMAEVAREYRVGSAEIIQFPVPDHHAASS